MAIKADDMLRDMLRLHVHADMIVLGPCPLSPILREGRGEGGGRRQDERRGSGRVLRY